MTPKKLITQIKDYADCTDASYAMLHFVEQNEKIDYSLDKLRSENPNESVRPPARWLYADGIKQGYEITKDNTTGLTDKNNRQIGEPTAYALAIEARFSENRKIQKPKADNPNELDKPQEIDNEIQSFVYREKDDKEAKKQKILVAINKKQQDENPKDFTYHLSPRTKAFISRFKLVSHQNKH